jgi:hypothetical protein
MKGPECLLRARPGEETPDGNRNDGKLMLLIMQPTSMKLPSGAQIHFFITYQPIICPAGAGETLCHFYFLSQKQHAVAVC